MSKITNDTSLTRSGTGCFISVPIHMATVGVNGLKLKPEETSKELSETVKRREWRDDDRPERRRLWRWRIGPRTAGRFWPWPRTRPHHGSPRPQPALAESHCPACRPRQSYTHTDDVSTHCDDVSHNVHCYWTNLDSYSPTPRILWPSLAANKDGGPTGANWIYF